MIVILQHDINRNSEEFVQLMDYLSNLPGVTVRVHEEQGTLQTLTELYLVGNTATLNEEDIASLPGVEHARQTRGAGARQQRQPVQRSFSTSPWQSSRRPTRREARRSVHPRRPPHEGAAQGGGERAPHEAHTDDVADGQSQEQRHGPLVQLRAAIAQDEALAGVRHKERWEEPTRVLSVRDKEADGV